MHQVFSNYVGQPHIKNLLTILLANARLNQSNLRHILIHGPSGYGKTTLAQLIGRALRTKTQLLNGNLLQTPAQIISLFTNLKPAQIIFIDEVHAISQRVAELLYPVMSEGRISVMLGKGYHARVVNLQLPAFTLIAATTLLHRVPQPLRNRFEHTFSMAPYSLAEIKTLVQCVLTQLQLVVSAPIVDILADRSRLNPRTAVHLTHTFRSFLNVKGQQVACCPVRLHHFLVTFGVYPAGVSQLEVDYMRLIHRQQGQFLSLATIAQMISYSERAIVQHIEPFLVQMGFIIKTTRGRQLSAAGTKLLTRLTNHPGS